MEIVVDSPAVVRKNADPRSGFPHQDGDTRATHPSVQVSLFLVCTSVRAYILSPGKEMRLTTVMILNSSRTTKPLISKPVFLLLPAPVPATGPWQPSLCSISNAYTTKVLYKWNQDQLFHPGDSM